MNLGIIAAGVGKRLKDEGFVEPKPLISLNGKTLLERVFDTGREYGFNSTNIIINEKFLSAIVDSGIFNKYRDLIINCIFKSTPSSLHSLHELKKFLSNDSFCLSTIDSIHKKSEFSSFVKIAMEEKDIEGMIAVTEYVDDEKPLWVNTDPNNIITAFSSSKNNSKFVTGGLYFFQKGIFKYTENAISANLSRLRNFLQYLVDSGIRLKAVPFSKIIDLDRRTDFEEAERFLNEAVNTI